MRVAGPPSSRRPRRAANDGARRPLGSLSGQRGEPCSTNARPPSSEPSCRSTSTTAQPVGSTHIADAPGCAGLARPRSATRWPCSSRRATSLQPHTSAGRVPTDKGYRVLRRPRSPSPGGSTTSRTRQVGSSSTPPTARSRRCCTTPPTCSPQLTSTPPSWSAPTPERGHGALGAARRALGPARSWSSPCSPTAPSRTPRSSAIPTPPTWRSPARPRRRHAHGVGLTLAALDEVRLPSRRGGDDPCDRARSSGACRRCAAGRPTRRAPVFVGGTASDGSAFDAVDTVRDGPADLEQQYVVVSLLRDVLDRGLTVAIGTEHGVEPLAACSVVVAPVDGRRRAGRHGRRARPDADELPAGAGHRRGGQRPPRPPTGTGGRRAGCMADDYYELLGVAPERHRRRDQEGLPAPGPRAAPRRQPGDPARRGAVQAGGPGLRGAQRSRDHGRATTASARPGVGGAGGGGPNFGDMFGGGGLGDLFDAFFGGEGNPFGGGGAGPAGRRVARTSRSSPTSPSSRRVRRHRAGHRAHRGALRRLRRLRRRRRAPSR